MVKKEKSQFCYNGAIVRLRLKNFMTYNDIEFEPGPNLNMILGANGTGKSTLVCCIIVSLAGEVTLTGRGGSPADFVKKDTDSGSTEIELYNQRGENYIVERKITITGRTSFKIDHKSDWKINHKNALKSEVQALTKKLNIKVDNLCQFLPQDSVTQFVKMNTCELLLNTLKAAGDNKLVDDHQLLVNKTKEINEKRIALGALQKSCEENEVNAKRLEAEVHQLRHREELVKQKVICGQKIHFVQYKEAHSKWAEAKKERDVVKEELKTIESSSEPYRRACDFHKSEQERLGQYLKKSEDEVKSASKLVQDTQNDIDNRKINCQEEFAKFKGKQEQESQRENSIRLKQQELDNYECRLGEIRDVDCSRQIAKIEADIAQNKQERLDVNREKARNEEVLSSQISEMNDLKREIESIERVQDRKIQLLRDRNPDAFKVMEWLSKNRHRFSDHIYNPMMCEINVKDPRYSRIVENAISRQELLSFVCKDQNDLSTFTRAVRDELKLRFNVILAPDKSYQEFLNESSQRENLSSLGVKAYLKDLIDAPEPIMSYLCGNNNFHRIPVADNCSEVQLKQLLAKCQRFYVGYTFYTVSRSRYDGQSMTVSDSVREALYLQISLDKQRSEKCREKYNRTQLAHDSNKKKRDEMIAKEDELRNAWQCLIEKHKELKLKHDERRRLEALIGRAQEAIKKLKDETIDIDLERRKLQQSIDKINKQILQSLEKLVGIYDNFIKLKETNMINLLLTKVAYRNYQVADRKFKNALRDTTRLKEDLRRRQNAIDTLKRTMDDHYKIADEKIASFKDGDVDASTLRKFNSVDANTVEDLINKREDLQIRITRIYKDSDNSVMREFQKQNEELKDKRIRANDLEQKIKEIDNIRESTKQTWLPKLQEVIDDIDKNYKAFMRKLSYDGQVKLDFDETKPDDFSTYGIMIKVKYRDNEELTSLSSTRQSGGERSVATMIYMLALQTKTSVPFRCVDEINQGMDKENERKVFELLVQTADSSSSQYFLVSPKLLNNLPYSEKMRIHVVYNGKNLNIKWNSL